MREFSGGYQIACGIGKIKDAHMVENYIHHMRYLSFWVWKTSYAILLLKNTFSTNLYVLEATY